MCQAASHRARSFEEHHRHGPLMLPAASRLLEATNRPFPEPQRPRPATEPSPHEQDWIQDDDRLLDEFCLNEQQQQQRLFQQQQEHKHHHRIFFAMLVAAAVFRFQSGR